MSLRTKRRLGDLSFGAERTQPAVRVGGKWPEASPPGHSGAPYQRFEDLQETNRVAPWGVAPWSASLRLAREFLEAVSGAERLPWPPAQGKRVADYRPRGHTGVHKFYPGAGVKGAPRPGGIGYGGLVSS